MQDRKRIMMQFPVSPGNMVRIWLPETMTQAEWDDLMFRLAHLKIALCVADEQQPSPTGGQGASGEGGAE